VSQFFSFRTASVLYPWAVLIIDVVRVSMGDDIRRNVDVFLLDGTVEGETVLTFEAQARVQPPSHFSLLFWRELLDCLDNFLPQLLQRHQLRFVLRLLLHESLCALTRMTNAVFAVMVFYRKIVSSLMAGVSFANGASRPPGGENARQTVTESMKANALPSVVS
jgi:hypothetical protein